MVIWGICYYCYTRIIMNFPIHVPYVPFAMNLDSTLCPRQSQMTFVHPFPILLKTLAKCFKVQGWNKQVFCCTFSTLTP